MDIDSARICQECGSVLSARAPLGLCPRCLVAAGLKRLSPSAASFGTALDSETTSEPSPPATRRFGDYELLEETARGGMGIVYRARQLSLDRIVAVKVLPFGEFASDEFIHRFRSEAQVAAALQHPNIVSIHEVGEQDGRHYFSMDYVAGRDLAAIVRDGPMPPRRVANYLQIICSAIQYSHEQGILHGDLKPSNILIDQFDQPRVTDFGLAKKFTAHSDFGQNLALGSPAYVPPEQLDPRLGPTGPASDIYSLGAILYHLLTGRVPFAADTVQQTLSQVIETEPAAPRLVNPAVPRDLETICLKCLHKKPQHRYGTARALGQDLARWLRGEPIAARPASRPERIWRWCRREPAVAGLTALAGLLFLSAALLVTWQWRRAEANANLYRLISYADGMKAAYAEFEEGNISQVNKLLDEQTPRPGQPDLRGFEWYYLYNLTRPKSFKMLARLPQVTGALGFSSDSRFVATYSWDDTSRLFDLDHPERPYLTLTNSTGLGILNQKGEFVCGDRNGWVHFHRLPSGEAAHAVRLEGELVASSGDSTRLVTIDSESKLRAFDSQTGKVFFTAPDRVPRRSDFGWNSLVAVSFDGRFLAYLLPARATQALDRVLVWDLSTRALVSTLQQHRVRTLAFSPEPGQLAIAGGDGSVLLADLQNGQTRSLKGHGLPLFALSFSADGKVLATGGSAETIQLWDVPTGQARPGLLRPFVGDIMSLAFSPDGHWLAVGGRDVEVRLIPVGSSPESFKLEGLNSKEWGNFAFSSDGHWMAAALHGGIAKVWEVETTREIATLEHCNYVVGFGKNNNELLVADTRSDPLWWNFRTAARTPVPAYSGSPITSANLCYEQNLAVVGHENGELALWQINSGQRLATWHGHADKVESLAFSPDGKRFVSGSRDRNVIIWNVADQRKLASNNSHRGEVCALAFSHDGTLVASACSADTIKIWNSSSMGRPLAQKTFHKAAVRTLDFSPDGRTLASGSDDETIRLWNVASSQEMARIRIDGPVQRVVFSPDGKHLAVVTTNGHLRLLSCP